MLAMLLSTIPAHADRTIELAHTSPWFLGSEVATSVLVGFVLPDLVSPTPSESLDCSTAWCGTNGFDVALNDAFRWSNPKVAGVASHVFTVGLTPVVGFAGVIAPAVASGHGSHGLQDSVIVLDAFLVATGANSIAKVNANRQRPAFHFDREDETEAENYPGEEFVSFYSGDTTWAFAIASSSSTLMFLRGYRQARWVAVGTGALALTGGVLRMSADMHWATDVLVGAASGTAIGIGIPVLLHHRKQGGGLAVIPHVGGLGVSGSL